MAITYRGGVISPLMLGNDALVQTLFCVENGIASRVNVLIRDLDVGLDNIGALTGVMPLLRTSRGINISGGILLAKAPLDTALVSDPAVNFRSALLETSQIAATPTNTIFAQFHNRMHTLVGQIRHLKNTLNVSCLPEPLSNHDFVLRPGQNLIVQFVGITAASNAAIANAFFASCLWEEDAIATFSISGTVTLSGSPVTGAIITVVEADNINMLNAVLRETIVTGPGGTWSSSIRTGKVGAAFVQYETGGTKYTAPGSPYLQ